MYKSDKNGIKCVASSTIQSQIKISNFKSKNEYSNNSLACFLKLQKYNCEHDFHINK